MAARKGRPASNPGNADLVRELDAVKRLLILLLAKLGSDSSEIASALGVGPSTIRTLMPMRKITKLPLAGEAD